MNGERWASVNRELALFFGDGKFCVAVNHNLCNDFGNVWAKIIVPGMAVVLL